MVSYRRPLNPFSAFPVDQCVEAAVAYADYGPASFVGPDTAGPYVYPAIRVCYWLSTELIGRVPETDGWVRSSEVEGTASWDWLVGMGRPLPEVLAEVIRLGAVELSVFEDSDDCPEWPDPSAPIG